MNKTEFIYDKLETVKFGFSMFSQVLSNLFTFLMNTTRDIKHFENA